MKTDLKTLRWYELSMDVDPIHSIPYKKSIQGYRIIFNEISDIEFFAHRDNEYCLWKISDAKLGLCFPEDCEGLTIPETIGLVYNRLKKYGFDKFKNETIPKAKVFISSKFPKGITNG